MIAMYIEMDLLKPALQLAFVVVTTGDISVKLTHDNSKSRAEGALQSLLTSHNNGVRCAIVTIY